MSHLFVHLPSFATDYSGAASVFYDLGGLVVIHEPSGCMGNFTGFDEPRWYHTPKAIFSSFIREEEAVLGDDSILIEKILRECRRTPPPFIAILGTPVPALIGCDLPGIAAEVADVTGIPAFSLKTSGFAFYQEGMTQALLLLEEYFMQGMVKKQPGTVNILGYSPLDFFLSGDDAIIKSFIVSCGYRVLSFIPGDGLEKIADAPGAEKNIVVSAAALPLAEKMREKYGIPYYAGLPCGSSGREKIRAFLRNDSQQYRANPVHYEKVLIIGEQVFANAVRDLLVYDCGYFAVTNATFFAFCEQLVQPGDIRLTDEVHLKNLIQENGYDLVIGDPLFNRFTSNETFIPLPHPAVSSRISWDSYISILDEGFTRYLSERMK